MLNLSNVIIPLLILLLSPTPLTFSSSTETADGAGDVVSCRQYVERSEIERRLSTKTPYRAIANYNDTPPIYNGMPFADSYS